MFCTHDISITKPLGHYYRFIMRLVKTLTIIIFSARQGVQYIYQMYKLIEL